MYFVSDDRLDEKHSLFYVSNFIVKELWDPFRKLISHSNELMQNLFRLVGVSENEMSPFCREFASLIDLRDSALSFVL